jgi:outer membrane murein-binding lipoprotein Lpp
MPREAFKPARFLDLISFDPVKKTISVCLFSLVLGSLFVFGGAGCQKKTVAQAEPKTLEQGVADLRAAVASANPQVQSNFFNGVSTGIRYGDYAKASVALQQIASDPSLNDQQKKVVNEVGDLLKQAIEGNQAPGQPAH